MNKLKQLKEKYNLTRRQIADVLGCSMRQVSRWIAGEKMPKAALEYLKICLGEKVKIPKIKGN